MKKYMKVIIVGLLLCINFVSCTDYKRNTKSGKVTEVTLSEGLKISKESKEALVMFTLDTCRDCQRLKEFLGPYLENHFIEINEVRLEREGDSEEERKNNRKKIQEVFPNFDAVPTIYYVKDGEVIDELIEARDEFELDEWVVKNKLDKK